MDINSLVHNSPPNSNPSSLTATQQPTPRARPVARSQGKAKLFQCTGYGDCRMVFTRSEHLARHARKHTGEKPFQCIVPNCNRMFSRFDNMMQHTQTHSNRQTHPHRKHHPYNSARTMTHPPGTPTKTRDSKQPRETYDLPYYTTPPASDQHWPTHVPVSPASPTCPLSPTLRITTSWPPDPGSNWITSLPASPVSPVSPTIPHSIFPMSMHATYVSAQTPTILPRPALFPPSPGDGSTVSTHTHKYENILESMGMRIRGLSHQWLSSSTPPPPPPQLPLPRTATMPTLTTSAAEITGFVVATSPAAAAAFPVKSSHHQAITHPNTTYTSSTRHYSLTPPTQSTPSSPRSTTVPTSTFSVDTTTLIISATISPIAALPALSSRHTPSPTKKATRRLSVTDLCNPIAALQHDITIPAADGADPSVVDADAAPALRLTEDEVEALQGFSRFTCFPVTRSGSAIPHASEGADERGAREGGRPVESVGS